MQVADYLRKQGVSCLTAWLNRIACEDEAMWALYRRILKEVGGAFYRAAPSDGAAWRSSRIGRCMVRLAGATCAGWTRALSARLSRRGKPC